MSWQTSADPVLELTGDDPSYGPEPMHLSLLGRWQLRRDGVSVPLPTGAQRLVALVALWGPKSRTAIAGTLWPDGTERRALGSLRTTLWRLQAAGLRVLTAEGGALALAPGVRVDVHEFLACARTVARTNGDPGARATAVVLRGDELLPGWYDDWVLLERERIHQLRLHALEAISEQLLRSGRHADALEAALAAVRAEPLRESARRAAVRVHLAERNPTEAVREYNAFRELLDSELGVRPSTAFTGLIGTLAARGHPRRADNGRRPATGRKAAP